jgi:hypothetical protein
MNLFKLETFTDIVSYAQATKDAGLALKLSALAEDALNADNLMWRDINKENPNGYDVELLIAYTSEYGNKVTGFCYYRDGEFYNEGYDNFSNEDIQYWAYIPPYPDK